MHLESEIFCCQRSNSGGTSPFLGRPTGWSWWCGSWSRAGLRASWPSPTLVEADQAPRVLPSPRRSSAASGGAAATPGSPAKIHNQTFDWKNSQSDIWLVRICCYSWFVLIQYAKSCLVGPKSRDGVSEITFYQLCKKYWHVSKHAESRWLFWFELANASRPTGKIHSLCFRRIGYGGKLLKCTQLW